jgi:hypothetical protein
VGGAAGGQKKEVGKKRWTVRKKRWAMRIINQVGIGIAVLSAMVAVAAYGQKDTASKADTVVDANGNLHVPDDYRTIYQFLGSWASCMHRPGLSLPIEGMEDSLMVRCS